MRLPNIIYRGLYGGWRMATFDKRGMAYFDLTVEGFWDSFLAIPLSGLILLAGVILPGMATAGHSILAAGIDMVALAVNWVVVLALMLGLSKLIDRPQRFSVFVITYNWTNVILRVAAILASTAASLVAGNDLAVFAILLLVWVYLVAVAWLVLRESLQIDIGMTFMLLFIVNILQLFMDYGTGIAEDRLISFLSS